MMFRLSSPQLAFFLFTTLAVNATPITVPNASFESPGSPVSTSTNPNVIPGWVFNVAGGSSYGAHAISSYFASEGTASGNDCVYINNDYPGVTDTITSAASLGAITADTTYILTVAIGNRNGTGLYNDPGNVSFSLLANGVAFATDLVNNSSVANGTFQDFSLTFTTPRSGSIIGDSLKIQLAALPEQQNAFQPAFDNIRFSEVLPDPPAAVPEPNPGAMLLLGLGALIFLLSRRRQLL